MNLATNMNRRVLLQSTLARFALVRGQSRRRYRAAIIGHTGAGKYGREWDTTWNGLDFVGVVAVAAINESGRKNGIERSHPARGYADFGEMLQKGEARQQDAIVPHELVAGLLVWGKMANLHGQADSRPAHDLIYCDAQTGPWKRSAGLHPARRFR